MKMVNVYLNLSIFTFFLKNRNFFSKIRTSKVTDYAALRGCCFQKLLLVWHLSCINKIAILSRRRIPLAVLLYEQLIHLTQNTLRTNIQLLSTRQHHTGQCKRTGGCYNKLVVAFFSTGGGVNGKKSIPVDFMICL